MGKPTGKIQHEYERFKSYCKEHSIDNFKIKNFNTKSKCSWSHPRKNKFFIPQFPTWSYAALTHMCTVGIKCGELGISNLHVKGTNPNRYFWVSQ
jgi:hypothetical protein